jgi:ABC-2 type transport system ATP-binding protein
MAEEVIKIRGLTKEYKDWRGRRRRVVAMDNLNLNLKKGEILAFLGPNGAGKTTVIKMICGLLLPDKGSIEINGYDVCKNPCQALREIGVVLEGSRNIYWRLTPRENLEYFGNLKGISGRVLKDRIENLLFFFDLMEKRNTLTKDLSRGMQQKLVIAISLIGEPEVLLLDEPTTGLDVHTTILIKERLKTLSRDKRKTIFLSTHQMEIAQDISDRVAIINQGRLAILEKTRDLNKELERVFLEATNEIPPSL